jgi:hypothetical protein
MTTWPIAHVVPPLLELAEEALDAELADDAALDAELVDDAELAEEAAVVAALLEEALDDDAVIPPEPPRPPEVLEPGPAPPEPLLLAGELVVEVEVPLPAEGEPPTPPPPRPKLAPLAQPAATAAAKGPMAKKRSQERMAGALYASKRASSTLGRRPGPRPRRARGRRR